MLPGEYRNRTGKNNSALPRLLSCDQPIGELNEIIRDEIRQMKSAYQARIESLMARLAHAEGRIQQADADPGEAAQATSMAAPSALLGANAFNPEISRHLDFFRLFGLSVLLWICAVPG